MTYDDLKKEDSIKKKALGANIAVGLLSTGISVAAIFSGAQGLVFVATAAKIGSMGSMKLTNKIKKEEINSYRFKKIDERLPEGSKEFIKFAKEREKFVQSAPDKYRKRRK